MESLRCTASEAERYINEGSPAAAEMILREAMASEPRNSRCWALLAQIADTYGDQERAARFRRVAAALDLSQPLQREDPPSLPAPPSPLGDRFLLIKAWGYGFFSDVDHVLGCLLLCEMTGRIPVTHWGKNSLFRLEDGKDSFRSYFEPLSPFTIQDLTGKGLDFWPPKWRETNVLAESVQKQFGEYSRICALHALHRPERVVVSDYHTGVSTLLPWLSASHPMYGRSVLETFRYLVNKYLRPARDILDEVEEFAARRFTSRPIIAAHVRGTDKFVEDRQHEQKLAAIPQAIDFFAGAGSNCGIFVLTDSSPILDQYRQRYGPRIIATTCFRSDWKIGPHYTGQKDRRRLGAEVLRDALLAARCDKFVGLGSSNVACVINHLHNWPAGSTILLGPLMTDRPNPTMYMSLEQLRRFFSADVLEMWKRGGVNV